jgi:hypothetical protein
MSLLTLEDRFEARRSFLDHCRVRQVGCQSILEYWIPAEDLPALNASILGQIKLVAQYHSPIPERQKHAPISVRDRCI